MEPSEIFPALITDLLRVHEYDYLLHIQASFVPACGEGNGLPRPLVLRDSTGGNEE